MNSVFLKKSGGFTLIELMIAMLIGVFLLGGIIQIFQGTQQSSRVNENASRMQENGRFAMDILSREIRMAGYIPCRIDPSDFPNNVSNSIDSPDAGYDFFQNPIGIDEGGVSAFAGYPPVGTAPGNRVAGADAIRILRGGTESSCVASHNAKSANFTLCNPVSTFDQFDILLVCDANNAALLQMTGPASAPPHSLIVHNEGVGAPGNCSKALGPPSTPGDCTTNTDYTFGADAQVVKFNSTAY